MATTINAAISSPSAIVDDAHSHCTRDAIASAPLYLSSSNALDQVFRLKGIVANTDVGAPQPRGTMSSAPSLTPGPSLLNTSSALPQEAASSSASLSTTRAFPGSTALKVDVSTIEAEPSSPQLVASVPVRMTPSVPISVTAKAHRFVFLQGVYDEVPDELGIALQDDSCFDYSVTGQTNVPSPIFISSRYVKLVSFAARADFSDRILESTSFALNLDSVPAEALLSLRIYQHASDRRQFLHCASAPAGSRTAPLQDDSNSGPHPSRVADGSISGNTLQLGAVKSGVFDMAAEVKPEADTAADTEVRRPNGGPVESRAQRNDQIYCQSSHIHAHNIEYPEDQEDEDYPGLATYNEGRRKMTNLMLDEYPREVGSAPEPPGSARQALRACASSAAPCPRPPPGQRG